jgi:UPF0755 protein
MKSKNFWVSSFLIIIILLILGSIIFIPVLAEQSFGPGNPDLGIWNTLTYSISLIWNANDLTQPVNSKGQEKDFVILPGDSVTQITMRLKSFGLIRNPSVFIKYLIWKGLDTTVQSGNYKLNTAMTGIEIAIALQDATPAEVEFNILPGWRMEEIAASLPTSGLNITSEEFNFAVKNPAVQVDYLPQGASAEGFLFPGRYMLPRETTAKGLISILLQNFSLYLSNDLREKFAQQGFDVNQAVILASIVEREAVVVEEQPLIASVFINRLNQGMKLESDPTVQYAIGFSGINGTWWKNPLTTEDLAIDSVYNTYLYTGLPPTPICNPDFSALQAVAYPAKTPYYFFRAMCDGSGRHSFAETFDQHIQNGCK